MMSSPALLDSLAGDAKPGADLSPRVAAGAQARDGLGYGGVDLLGQAEHEGQGLDVTVADTAAVCVQDAADECPVLVVLDGPPSPVRCQPGLDTGSRAVVACTNWVVRHDGGHLLAPSARPPEG